MTAFMDQDFLLSGDMAKYLYHTHAAKMPVIDYHCHINPRQIYEDRPFDNLAQVWLGEDHYKWRAMRANGVEEKYITGSAAPYEKFRQWAATVPLLIGNPLYHWTHLELRRYFDIDQTLSPDTCEDIWRRANEKLKTLSPRKIIELSRVKVICTTDDPADDLRWHALLQKEQGFDCKVLPAFRPDRAMNIESSDFPEYIRLLENASGISVRDFDTLMDALEKRLDFFVSMGCRAADHGLSRLPALGGADASKTLEKALQGREIKEEEAENFKAALLISLAAAYQKRGVVMQIHYGAARNNSRRAFETLGPDTGFDAIVGAADSGSRLGSLLDAMDAGAALPKTIVYSLNPADNALITAMTGCFQTAQHPAKIQHGSAWWFNDSITGMTEQLVNLANYSALGRFIGMLTDSRSFLSYVRHEYFRRILCALIGSWVDRGEYPADYKTLGRMVEDISFYNVNAYFGFGADAADSRRLSL